ncbi:hypothetical protein ONE63_008133 [Megalurothrips usitatus]|uniref:Uncharacterized protein n=1 Tax=Megalurothrips usitatus TaxID=439358 RepID=A0AAV7XSR6_9NEOP|nr:hypothetical protein ONE63_008133 [Megalurothrips usitatus]
MPKRMSTLCNIMMEHEKEHDVLQSLVHDLGIDIDSLPTELIDPTAEADGPCEEECTENFVEPPEGMFVRPRGLLAKIMKLNLTNKLMEIGLDLRRWDPYFMLTGYDCRGNAKYLRFSADEFLIVQKDCILKKLAMGFFDADAFQSFDVGGIKFEFTRYNETPVLNMTRFTDDPIATSISLSKESFERFCKLKKLFQRQYFYILGNIPKIKYVLDYLVTSIREKGRENTDEIVDNLPMNFYMEDPLLNEIAIELMAYHNDYVLIQTRLRK